MTAASYSTGGAPLLQSSGDGSKLVTLIRHAESEWNAERWSLCRFLSCRCCFDPMIFDPRVTRSTGRAQLSRLAAALGASWLATERVQAIVVSPFTRALETAVALFPPEECKRLGVRIIVSPLCREIGETSSDVGSDPPYLKAAFPALDFGDLAAGWWRPAGSPPAASATEVRVEPRSAWRARVTDFRSFLAALPETRIVCIGHGHFWQEFARLRSKMANCGTTDVRV